MRALLIIALIILIGCNPAEYKVYNNSKEGICVATGGTWSEFKACPDCDKEYYCECLIDKKLAGNQVIVRSKIEDDLACHTCKEDKDCIDLECATPGSCELEQCLMVGMQCVETTRVCEDGICAVTKTRFGSITESTHSCEGTLCVKS